MCVIKKIWNHQKNDVGLKKALWTIFLLNLVPTFSSSRSQISFASHNPFLFSLYIFNGIQTVCGPRHWADEPFLKESSNMLYCVVRCIIFLKSVQNVSVYLCINCLPDRQPSPGSRWFLSSDSRHYVSLERHQMKVSASFPWLMPNRDWSLNIPFFQVAFILSPTLHDCFS